MKTKISGVLFLEQPLILPAPSLSQKCEPVTWKELRKLIYTPIIKGSIPNIVDIVLYCIRYFWAGVKVTI